MNALNSDLIKLGQLSQRCGKALEQEAIWVPLEAVNRKDK
jgi:hypothetical protein